MKRVLTGAALVLIVASSVFLYFVFSVPCLLLKDGETGETLAKYQMSEGEEFSVTFIHSVNNSPVTDVYEFRDGRIFVVRTIIIVGAGWCIRVGEDRFLNTRDDGSMIVQRIRKANRYLS